MAGFADIEAEIPALRRYAWSLLRHDADADDLVQDTLLRALDAGPAKRDAGEIRPFLFTIMHNLHVSRWRRLVRRARVSVDAPDADAPVAPAQQGGAEMREVLERLAALPEEHRQVLLLAGVEGFGYAEIADILGVPVGTVMSRLSRARDRLREAMEGRARPALRPQLRRVK